MTQPKRIRAGMVVKSRAGEPLGRVLSVDDEGFVLERRVVITREHRVRLDEVHELEADGVVIHHARTPPLHAEAKDLTEVFWSARRARDEQKPLDERETRWSGVSQRIVAVTEHAEAYPVQVERGTVSNPRYVPMSEEQLPLSTASGPDEEEPRPPRSKGATQGAPPPRPSSRLPWNRGVLRLAEGIVARYAARPFIAATSLLERLRGAWTFAEH
ncbi:hypothetical protein [Archangium lipolyticum]|uniref:hypothetical protein n=1 Tax=Archangium lipolyticum TaxID=2970465 RepID=UPI002149AA98|nr:hypothetical protein [Archangium lipolyticum]